LEAVLCKTFLHNDSPEERIQKCLLDIYHTEEMRPLFDQSEDWVQSLAVCGMDPQPTYPCISEQMLKWLKQHIDNDLYERIQTAESLYFELDKEIMFKVTKALKQRIKVMITEYESILNEMDKMCQTFTEPEIHNMFQVIKRGLLNRLQWLKVNLKGYFSSGTARSFYMFENLEWLMNHYFKNEKIIVWAHNFISAEGKHC
jgi:erythromycin esterase